MMSGFRCLTLLTVVLLVSGCGRGYEHVLNSRYQKVGLSHYEVVPETKAVVFLGTRVPATRDHFLRGRNAYNMCADLRFVKNRDFTKSPGSEARFAFWEEDELWDYCYQGFVVDPGFYHLTDYKVLIPGGHLELPPGNNGLDDGGGEPTFLSFDIEAGDIAYLGNIRLDITKPYAAKKDFDEMTEVERKSARLTQIRRVEFSVLEDQEEFQAFMARHYPNYIAQIRPKLAVKGTHPLLPLIDSLRSKVTYEIDDWATQFLWDH